MNFEEFLKTTLSNDNGGLIKLSRFKHENEKLYSQFRSRVKKVQDYHEKQRSRYVKDGKIIKPLTAENFSEYEKYALAQAKLNPVRNENNKIMDYESLTPTQKQDIYYHAMFQGRVDKATNEASYTQEDYDWLKSPEYADIESSRRNNSRG